MLKGPAIIGARYINSHLAEAPGGKRALAGLPKREPGELREIKSILSSHHCRTCAKCCRGAFSIGEDDRNFASIRKLVKARKKEFRMENMGRGRTGIRYYDIGVPMNRNACGFLEWEGGRVDHRTLIYSSGKDRGWKPFSCGIYDARASVCIAYPINVAWMHLGLGNGKRDDNGTVIIDAACPAVNELMEEGIGHLSESEILSLAAEPDVDRESLLFSLPKSLQEVKERVAEAGKENRILVNEEGERVYPLNAWEIFI